MSSNYQNNISFDFNNRSILMKNDFSTTYGIELDFDDQIESDSNQVYNDIEKVFTHRQSCTLSDEADSCKDI
jgi:hypothetical protein